MAASTVVVSLLFQVASAVVHEPSLPSTDGKVLHTYDSKKNDTSPGTPDWGSQTHGQRDLATQLVLSVSLGLIAFLAFCTLRPKWTELYAARRKKRNAASQLPELPDSFFGWIPVLYRITDEEVLDSAGLDAYVFLSFFKFALRFLTIAFLCAALILLPIHYRYAGRFGIPGWDEDGDDKTTWKRSFLLEDGKKPLKSDPSYLWIYVVFAYVFSGLAVYLLLQETNKIIRTRQKYLGSQAFTTDRTFRLSGVPPSMRSEEKIKEFVESLHIGKVETITICRNWKELDMLMDERKATLRKLERAWTKHLGYKKRSGRDGITLPLIRAYSESRASSDGETEQSPLLVEGEGSQPHVSQKARSRPTKRLWYGPLKLRHRTVDAIDYYEERLRRLDERILAARQKEYPPTSLAFVTMETTAACQMAVQTILDPHPMELVPTLAPAPADVIWKNTYVSRTQRMTRGWLITLIIGFLTVFWSVLLVPFATLLEWETLHKVIPPLADALTRHPVLMSLVRTGLPTLGLSLLTVAVPYVYSWLSSFQGMTARGDIELSVISKNFFFSFFNLFLVFTVIGSASSFYSFWENLRDAFKDATTIAFALARSLESFSHFYINLILLQGFALFPFRLLEIGSVALYPISFLWARTPREYAELSTPPRFSYAFSIPQTILVFILCVVYSVFPSSWLICLCGLIYFILGKYIYKYQLLYAMDHQQHSTGLAWPMICSRVFVGLVVFQLAMIGVLALRRAIARSLLVVPLLGATVWFTYFFARTYEPLMKFIALRSIDQNPQDSGSDSASGRDEGGESLRSPPPPIFSPPSGLDRDSIPVLIAGREVGLRLKKYVNPSLILPLDEPWIPGREGSIRVRAGVFETVAEEGEV